MYVNIYITICGGAPTIPNVVFVILITSLFILCISAEGGNVTLKCDGVTRYLCHETRAITFRSDNGSNFDRVIMYGESCAVLRHNCPHIKPLFPVWDSPFKKLSSSHKVVYVCLTMYSPLKELYGFNKHMNTLRVKMAQRSPED
jgi:hypothetical protein